MDEDLCGFAALVMMSLDQTVLYTTHRSGPRAAEIAAGIVLDVSVQPCGEVYPLGLFGLEEEGLAAPTPRCRCHAAGRHDGGARRPALVVHCFSCFAYNHTDWVSSSCNKKQTRVLHVLACHHPCFMF